MNQRRLKLIDVDPNMVFTIIKDSQVDNKLSDGTEYVSTFYDESKQCFSIILTNDRYDEVKIGEQIPKRDNPVICSFSLDRLQDNHLEQLAESIHKKWCEKKISKEYHLTTDCQNFYVEGKKEIKERFCDMCEPNLKPYLDLEEVKKEYLRQDVINNLDVIRNLMKKEKSI